MPPAEAADTALLQDLAGFQAAVLAWFDVERRDLPFRRTRDPYLVLVSEAMAQQTQIGRVAPAWERFVARFPTVGALAAARLDDVLRAWAGLGYNRRAVSLHRAARLLVTEHGGRIPDDPSVLETLPGVGPYTARAVAAIAFGRPVAAVDTNVRRVLSRVIGVVGAEAGFVGAVADAAVPAGRSADWTPALMDLGSRHCRPRPRCDGCPARPWCATGSGGEVRQDPVGVRRSPAPRGSTPFPSTTRWLRGRIVAVLRETPGWHRFEGPLGVHDRRALTAALVGLARDGIVEVDADEPLRARLASGEAAPQRSPSPPR